MQEQRQAQAQAQEEAEHILDDVNEIGAKQDEYNKFCVR
jgi:hypothetical protein